MDIIVCVARVPDATEAEVEIDRTGRGVKTDDFVYGINEWDNFAVEAALALKEEHGGTVTAVTVGDEDAEEVLRRALAMGADAALHLMDPAFEGSDAAAIARILYAAIAPRPHDLVLTGAVTGDGGSGHVGGMLAGLAGVPHVTLATDLSVEGSVARARHEVEGGLERVVELDLPAVVTVQTGINEPRYVSIRGIRKVRNVEIPVAGAADIGLDPATVGAAGCSVVVEELFLPSRGDGAEMLEGRDEEMVDELVKRLREQGGIR